jgi:hypothetical protein
MRIGRSDTPWIIFVIVASAGFGVLYVANVYPQLVRFPVLPAFLAEATRFHRTFGGTPLGLIFGSAAFLIFLFASALGIRKKKRTWPIGGVQTWLRAHVWLTFLTVPLVLFHCGFHGGGRQTTWLLILYTLVMGSGVFGLVLQQFVPRLMRQRLPHEVVFEEIPYIRAMILQGATKTRGDIEKLESATLAKSQPAAVAAGAPLSNPAAGTVPESEDSSTRVLAEFLDKECLPYLAAERGNRHPLGDEQRAEEIFRALRLNVSRQWQPKVEELQTWCNDRRLMDLQVKLHHWLHGWLILHVPGSFALLVFTGWHAWVAARFLVLPY